MSKDNRRSKWARVAGDFSAGKVDQAWFYMGDDMNPILEGHRIESASMIGDSMVTFVMSENLMVQVYAGSGIADTGVALSDIASRSGEIEGCGYVTGVAPDGRRLTSFLAQTSDEYGSEDVEVLFKASDVGARSSASGRMFFGVAFRAPSVAAHAVGADR